MKNSRPSCLNGYTGNIIPLVYGEPNEKAMEKANQGKIHLGGCVIIKDAPKYYCTIHKIEIQN
jgi:hypothetical protein